MSPKTDSEKQVMANKPYRSLLVAVMWGQLTTCPDLSFSVSLLAHFQSNPGLDHWNALLHTVGYIKNTLDFSLSYSRDYDLPPPCLCGCRLWRMPVIGHENAHARMSAFLAIISAIFTKLLQLKWSETDNCIRYWDCQRTPQSTSHYSRHLRQSPIHPSTHTTEPPPAARDPTVV